MRRTLLSLLLLLLALPASAWADSIVGSPGAGAQPFPAWPAALGSPYWNQPSADGANKNIGYFLTNTGAFSGSTTGPGGLPYWGMSGGGADPNFYFQNNSAGSYATLLIEIAGFAPTNAFGWYQVGNPSVNGIIFPGAAGSGASTTVVIPVGNYGFFLYVGATGYTFFTQSTLNPTGDKTHQHFAVFIQGGSVGPVYWIGMEDLKAGNTTLVNKEGGVGDYNDMVVRITPIAPVPEPGTLALFGTGLLGIAGVVRRRLGRKELERN